MTINNKSNKRYSKEEKEKLIARMFPPESITPTKLSEETGISKSTLATWKAKVIKGSGDKKVRRSISSQEKFMIVMETYMLSEIELGKYCREKGLYVQDIKTWRSSCIAANNGTKSNSIELSDELKEEKRKSKELAKELRRKEKALAETAALLVLRKKLDAIFEENEED